MTARDLLVDVLAWAGVGVVLVSCLCLPLVRGARARIHLVTPVTSLGSPLVGAAVALRQGWTLSAAEVLFTVALLAGAGPVVASELGRLAGVDAAASAREEEG